MTFLLRHDVKGMTPRVLFVLDPSGVVFTLLHADMTRDVRDVQSLV